MVQHIWKYTKPVAEFITRVIKFAVPHDYTHYTHCSGYVVEATKSAPRSELVKLLMTRLDKAMACGEKELARHQLLNGVSYLGTTFIECKTGYGLDYATELKMLQVIDEAKQRHAIEIVTTYLGAHAVPRSVVTSWS